MNPDALEDLYDTYAEPLFRYLCSLVRSEAEAKDRLQDLFLKVARNPGCLDNVTHVKAYLFRLAHNLAVDAIRRGGNRREKHDRLAAEPLPIFANTMDPDVRTWRESMARALAELPLDQCEVVYLKLFEEMTFDAIASLLSISMNTAASRYRYGMEKLRRSLKPLYDELNEDA